MSIARKHLIDVPSSTFRDYVAMLECLGPIEWNDFVAGYRAMVAFYADRANHRPGDRDQDPAMRKAS
jgi:hypothetical protein